MKKLITAIGLCLLTANLYAVTITDLGITPGQPSDPTSEYNHLLGQIGIYNTVNDPDLTAPTFQSGMYQSTSQSGGKFFDFEAEPPFTGYLMFKWGNEDQFYFVEDLDEHTFNSTVYNQNGRSLLGLSHWDSWVQSDDPKTVNVPENSNTMALMGIGAVGLVAFRRKFSVTV